MSLYAIKKDDYKVHYICPEKQNLDIMLANAHEDIKDYIILQEFNMKYVSRITYIDGNCVYNNKEYWTKTAVQTPLTKENYSAHEVLDFMGNPVPYDRYVDEFNNNMNRLVSLDGIAGEVEYNETVGKEFIGLFREECINTKFDGITPLEIGLKLGQVILLVQTGAFREAKEVLQTIETDPFLTEERIAKYIAMMDAADVIEYAT